MNNPAAFNINSNVSVRIKPEGFVFWKAQDDAARNAIIKHNPFQGQRLAYYEAKAGPDGRVIMQLHEFMRIFGRFSVGFDVPYETDIWLSVDNPTPPQVLAVCAGGSGYVDA